MDHIDYLYVRVRTEELLARLSESETITVNSGGMVAAPRDPVKPAASSFWRRLRRAVQLRRRSIRVLSDAPR